MADLLSTDKPILFLGLADHLQQGPSLFPYTGIDLFQLAQHKAHIVYPGFIRTNTWIFLLDPTFLRGPDARGMTIRITHESGELLGNVVINEIESISKEMIETEQKATVSSSDTQQVLAAIGVDNFALLPLTLDGMVNMPGKYNITASYAGRTEEVGSVEFHYRETPSFTPDQTKAIQADPAAAKTIRFDLGCKFCSKKLATYTGLARNQQMEKDGAVWHRELGEEFNCDCGKTRFSLRYLRESMHGLLLKDFAAAASGLSYVRQYGHAQVTALVSKYNQLLDKERLEGPVQAFLEKNPMLLARFHARRLFVKPSIIGRFQADFAILDTQNELWFIELERPSLKLFKADGHPTAHLMHAYGQVTDWLHQYSKYQGAILDALKLQSEEVVGVRGAIIAGRSANIAHSVLQRHHLAPPYPRIELMTLDDLAASLINLSRKIA